MNPFIGQIMIFAGNFAPRGWAFCQGQLLPISQNTALFSILGTTYAGDGRTTFGLPDMQGRKAVSEGNGPGLPSYRLGEKGGNPTTVLTVANLPAAQVSFPASSLEGDNPEPINNVYAVPSDDDVMYSTTPNGNMASGALIGAQNTSFSNEAPYLAVNYIIALVGTFPSRS
ncbi:MAG: microcystin-dependent protein [Saprospiraceae bacterium]|jgi:microcystin-dependent protein